MGQESFNAIAAAGLAVQVATLNELKRSGVLTGAQVANVLNEAIDQIASLPDANAIASIIRSLAPRVE